MRRGKLIAGLAVGLLIVVGSVTAYRWVKRAFGNAHTATGTSEAALPKQQAPLAMPPIVIKGAVMGQAFRSGRLPEPLPQPAGTPEQAAAELAKRVMAEDEQSTAAFLTALQMSGFSVRADDGSVAYESVKPGQGIIIDAWEAAALAKLFGDGMRTRLTDFSNALASTLPPLKNAPVDKLLLDGLRAAAQGNQPAMHFWADFIAELGRQSEHAYDILAPEVDTTKVELDAIQVSLILRRLVADLMLLNGNKNQKAQRAPAPEPGWSSQGWQPALYDSESGGGQYVRDAVWHPDVGPRLVLVQEAGGSSQPCTLKELESQIMDTTAYGYTKAFDSMLEYLAEHAGMEGAEKYSNATAAINAILAIVKLIAYYACMETDITMSGDPPLVRTQSLYQAGEKRTLTATVRENIGKWQALNCARIALNGVNLDISLPNDGPVGGVKTQWVLTSGSYDYSHGDYTLPFVELVFPDGTPTVQNATVPITDASAPKTDEEGHTTIDIEGVKQREKLSSAMPIMKQAAVRFTVAAKPVTMRQDLIDAAGLGIAGGVALGVGGPVEMLLRSNIYFSKQLNITVKDWESCDGAWGGTINYVTTYHYVHNESDAENHSTYAKDQTIHDEIRLRSDPNDGAGGSGSSGGTFTASYGMEATKVTTWPPLKSFGGATITAKETASAAGGGKASIEIYPSGDNKYQIRATGGDIPGVDLTHSSCSGDCKGKNAPDTTTNILYSPMLPVVTAHEDPDKPGELHGSTTLEELPMKFATTTVNWNLKQCQSRQ